jgi:trimeric autotransporter adhesin
MRTLIRMMLPCLLCAQLSYDCLAQHGIITAYVMPGLPGRGASATTQSLDKPTSVAPDGFGGFYAASPDKNRVYHLAADGRLRVVAGSGASGYSGDGGQATLAQLSYPRDIAVDSAGNLYIADTFNDRIRKVASSGVITTVAGNKTRGYSGDGDQAASAQLSNPFGIAVDSAGNLYIADTYNDRVRKITSDGVITTIAGNGTSGFGGDGGKAASAQLSMPSGIAVDSAGNLYIADWGNNRIRKVTAEGVITTVAGNGKDGYSGDGGQAITARLSGPFGVAVDSAGNLYIADPGNHRIRKVTSGGVITTIAGNGKEGYTGDGGQAALAQLNKPDRVVVDSAGNLYIADSESNCIRKITPAGVITTIA